MLYYIIKWVYNNAIESYYDKPNKKKYLRNLNFLKYLAVGFKIPVAVFYYKDLVETINEYPLFY